ncbi:MAG: OmpA family protein [Sphingobacteriales bacterium]|nr:MAG: OmpA family protein [Sphingobacteriales bacterium]
MEIEFDAPRLYTLPDVLFATGTFQLKPRILATLNGMAEYMLVHPADRYGITGYTDNVGTMAANKRLSEKRAEVVRDYLVTKGVPPGRLEASGLGAEKPVAGNNSPEGRRKNRRTEIAVL